MSSPVFRLLLPGRAQASSSVLSITSDSPSGGLSAGTMPASRNRSISLPALDEHVGDDVLDQFHVVSEFLLEPAVRAFAGCMGQTANAQEAFIAAKLVQETVGVGFSEGELHDVGAEHVCGRVTWVPTVSVRLLENVYQGCRM